MPEIRDPLWVLNLAEELMGEFTAIQNPNSTINLYHILPYRNCEIAFLKVCILLYIAVLLKIAKTEST